MIEAEAEGVEVGKRRSNRVMFCLHLETPDVMRMRDSLVRSEFFKGRGGEGKMIMSGGRQRSRGGCWR